MDLLVTVYPSALAGLGPARWLWGTHAVVKSVGKHFGIPACYVGPLKIEELDLTPDVAIEPAESIGDRYASVENALRKAIFFSGARRIGVVSVGYTAYTSWALKRLAGSGASVDLVILDSSPPDTDEKRSTEDASGLPVTRFHWQSYAATPDVSQRFYLCSTYRYDPVVVAHRVPQDMSGEVLVGRHPYPKEYEDFIRSTKPARRQSRGKSISVVCSGDYWGELAVGKWMTRPQYGSMVSGTMALMRGIELAARTVGPITVSLDKCGYDALEQVGYENAPEVITLAPFSPLPHPEHLAMLKGSDLLIARGGNQTNAVAAATLMEVPFVFWDVPAHRYMQTGQTNAPAISQGLLRGVNFDASWELIAKAIVEELAGGGSRCQRRLEEFLQTPTLEETLIRTFRLG
ncbi:MAG: hypothetical protein HY975_02125 [Candidatus Kerfeldbacteria bacterium]|nr:hypothetical protein [Candidatus Kerfeldbacteria bacterium]